MLHDGSIAEMKTGEGKTLVSTLAAYLNALTSEGVHGMCYYQHFKNLMGCRVIFSGAAGIWLYKNDFSDLDFFAVVTVNDYLAQRDAEWMGRVHRFLGLSVGLIQVNSLSQW